MVKEMTDKELMAKLAASLSEVGGDMAALVESVQRLRRRLDALVSGMPAAEPETPVEGQEKRRNVGTRCHCGGTIGVNGWCDRLDPATGLHTLVIRGA